MTKNAPTKRIENYIETGLTVDLQTGVTLCARVNHPYAYEEYNPVTGEVFIEWNKGDYSITSHKGLMPPFYTESFNSLQDLANAMRAYADLRTWRLIDWS